MFFVFYLFAVWFSAPLWFLHSVLYFRGCRDLMQFVKPQKVTHSLLNVAIIMNSIILISQLCSCGLRRCMRSYKFILGQQRSYISHFPLPFFSLFFYNADIFVHIEIHKKYKCFASDSFLASSGFFPYFLFIFKKILVKVKWRMNIYEH